MSSPERIKCQNCGQITTGDHCEWCGYPVTKRSRKRGNKFYLILALLLAFTVSGGVYTYTYTTSSAGIKAEAVAGDFATVEPAPANLPDWELVLEGIEVVTGEAELYQAHDKSIVIPEALKELRLLQCHNLDITLQEYVQTIVIKQSHDITILAEKGYGEEVEYQSHNITISVGPGPIGPPGLCGEVPNGDLFVITPNEYYTGDLKVHVYLTNVAALTKAYQYLNIKLYLENSEEAKQTPNYQLITLDNGVATFTLKDCPGVACTLKVIGGSYRLVSDDPNQWSTGWSITPEFYCEVSQR